MRKLVAALIVVPLGVLLVALAVVNRKPVTLGLNPFDAQFRLGRRGPVVPVSARRLCPWTAIGGLATWLSQGKWRKTARAEARAASTWRRQADRLEKELEGLDARPSARAPRRRLTGHPRAPPEGYAALRWTWARRVHRVTPLAWGFP